MASVKAEAKDAYDLDKAALEQIEQGKAGIAYAGQSGRLSLAEQIITHLLTAADASIWSSISKYDAITQSLTRLGGAASRSAASHHGYLRHILAVRLPEVHNYAANRVDSAITLLKAYARGQANSAYQHAHTEIVTLAHNVAIDLQNLRQQLTAKIDSAVAQLTAGIHSLAVKEQADFQRAEADARVEAQAAQQTAILVAGQNADTAARDAWAPLWAGITTGVAGAITAAGEDFPILQQQLAAIVATEPATLAEAETAAAAAIPPMLTALQQCVVPGCRDLGNLRDMLHTLQDALTAALLLAWIVQMITDPQAWARESYDAFGPVVSGGLDVIRALGAIP